MCVPVVGLEARPRPHVSQLRPEVAVAAPVMEPEVPVVPTVLSLCVGVCKQCVCAWLSGDSRFILLFFSRNPPPNKSPDTDKEPVITETLTSHL